MAIKLHLKEILKEYDINIDDLYIVTGVPKNIICKMINNKLKVMDLNALEKICNYIGITPSDLISSDKSLESKNDIIVNKIIEVINYILDRMPNIVIILNHLDIYNFTIDNSNREDMLVKLRSINSFPVPILLFILRELNKKKYSNVKKIDILL